jgi:uncharacterized protein
MPLTHAGLEVLDEHECFRLLSSTQLGRVALTVGALPVILPVHYALLGHDPVFRTDHGAKLMAASAGNILALEADAADPIDHHGWSVLGDGPDLEQAKALPLRPWVGRGDVFVRLKAVLVSGRRVASPVH